MFCFLIMITHMLDIQFVFFNATNSYLYNIQLLRYAYISLYSKFVGHNIFSISHLQLDNMLCLRAYPSTIPTITRNFYHSNHFNFKVTDNRVKLLYLSTIVALNQTLKNHIHEFFSNFSSPLSNIMSFK